MKHSWEVTSLGDLKKQGLADVQTGPFGTVLKASEYSKKGVPLISVGEIREGYLQVTERTPFVSTNITKRLPQFILAEGDIVFGRKGAIDRNSIINAKEEGWFLGSDAIRLRLSKEINSVFISYQLRSKNIGKWLLQNSSGSIMASLNQKILDRLPLMIPEKPKQDQIASTLSSIDSKIELNNRINAELEAMAKTIYDYWFVQFNFPFDFAQGKPIAPGQENKADVKPYKSSGGEMVWNEKLKREVPKGWGVKVLGEVVEKTGTGLNPRKNFELGEGDNFYVTIKNIKQGRVLLDDRCDKISNEALRIIDKRSDLQEGDILFTSIEPVGTTYLIHEKPTNWNINESVFTIRPDLKKLTSEYLFMFLSGDYLKAYTKNVAYGSIHKGIRHSTLKECKIVLPPTDFLNSFSKVISPVLSEMDLAQKENQELASLRDWLLPMLMNGQVKVSSAEASETKVGKYEEKGEVRVAAEREAGYESRKNYE